MELVFFEATELPKLKGIQPPGAEIYAWRKFKPESLDALLDSKRRAAS